MYPEETNLYHAILTGALVLVLLVAILVVTIIFYHRRKLALHKTTVRTELNVLEQERARIAADLHDDLGSSLAAIKIRLQSLPVTGEREEQLVHQSENYIDDAMLRLKRVSFNLMPLVLERRGLKQALEELVNTLQEATGISIAFSCACPPLPHEQTVHIYRIIQEALTNSIKHSGAATASVEIKAVKNAVLVLVADNGKGFNKRNMLRHPAGRGLQNIMARVDALNATLHLTAGVHEGVSYFIQIPNNT